MFAIIGILGILNRLIYPDFNVILIPILCGLSLWVLLEIRKFINYKPQLEINKLEKRDRYDLYRAWKYHNKADLIFQHRISFFLVAESMLLVSFATIYNISKIQLAIAALGVIITFCWFYVNIRIAWRRRMLKDNYLKKFDPIYKEYMNCIRGFPASTVLAYILPNSFILLWIFARAQVPLSLARKTSGHARMFYQV